LPGMRYDTVLTVERRISREGMVAVAGNYYSVPDTTRRRVVDPLALCARLTTP
ncbi:Mu transposase domain-containing protein, partial [Novosphingobium guangzhouense]|uniref:Mu transposase domain-containing protein n=1 Tax=Novosphingobium guangzhouense TaxID=1850347 RepID=UPI003CCB8AF7